jgi:plasmid stabilization system protein ParE
MGKQVGKLSVVWDRKEYQNFEYILNNIRSQSPLNSIRVKNRVNNIIKKLPDFPYKFEEDKLKRPRSISYRAFSKDNIRVSYRVTKTNIQIVRVKHSKQEPLNY